MSCNQMLENMILGSRTFTKRNVAGATSHGPVLINLNSMYVLQCLRRIQYCNPINRKFKSRACRNLRPPLFLFVVVSVLETLSPFWSKVVGRHVLCFDSTDTLYSYKDDKVLTLFSIGTDYFVRLRTLRLQYYRLDIKLNESWRYQPTGINNK
jgi:hypothetical protein